MNECTKYANRRYERVGVTSDVNTANLLRIEDMIYLCLMSNADYVGGPSKMCPSDVADYQMQLAK